MLFYRSALVVLFCVLAASPLAKGDALELRAEDRIVFAGNTLAERMREYNYFETLLRCRFPDLGLTFRNMGWSADEITLRPRPLNFGDIHQHLTDQKADVIFLMYGLNESFAGEAALPKFIADYAAFIGELQGHQYDGAAPPRLVIVSPTPQEPMANLPDVQARNAVIGKYTDALRTLAGDKGLAFVDLFNGLNAWRDRTGGTPLTFNGVHMEAAGYWAMALVMMGQLGWSWPDQRVMVDLGSPSRATRFLKLARPTEGGCTLEFSGLPLPAPAPPPGAAAGSATLVSPVVVQVSGLPEGVYGIYAGDTRLGQGTDTALAQGVAVQDVPAQEAATAALELARHKNRLFFDRWRAVNGYYIYGDRKEPFGVQSFPLEMQRFDELVRDEEVVLNDSLSPFSNRTLELRREDSAS